MKKKLIVLITLVAALTLIPLGAALAQAQPTLDWGSEVNANQCPPGPVVINVTHKVVNSLDSGMLAWWAYDEYNREIQVRQIGPTTFCAVVRYQGKFTTVSGPSPAGADSQIALGLQGTFEGGYRATITGGLLPSPLWPTRGHISAIDHQCTWTDSNSDNVFNYGEESCPGAINWTTQYFSAPGFSFDWWGWIYRGGNNGTWVNSSDGNQGDITD